MLAAATLSAAVTRTEVLPAERAKLSTIYLVAPPSHLGPETALSKTYLRLLTRYVQLARTNLHDWPAEPGAKFHKTDGSQEHAVRQNASVALDFATVLTADTFDESAAGATREQVRADAVALIRYLAVTHNANFLPTGDGKSWGDHWQSAFWAAVAGQAAWLIWPDLPDDTKVMVARMVIHEADRYNQRPPDNGENHDTKAEENAWNSEVIALAPCMFPQHPNAPLWRERAIVYMINSFSTAADSTNETIVDGRRVKDWVTTTNIHSDFTLENHNRVHPDYLSTFTLNLRNALYYQMAGQPVPQAMFHHVNDCVAVIEHLTATNGSFFYVNGQDWWPHRHELPMLVGGLVSVLLHDGKAAAMENAGLQSLLKLHCRFTDGRCFAAQEVNYPNVEEELMARYAELYLAHRLYGDFPKPVSLPDFQTAQLGTRIFEAGGFVTHRTRDKFASFTWVNGAMGLVFPSDDTWFTAPCERSLTGRITVQGTKDTVPKLEKKNVFLLSKQENPGFAFIGTFSRCEGKIEQRLAMISLPDGPVIYLEELQARVAVNVEEIATATVAIFNEDAKPLNMNERHIWTDDGEIVAHGATDQPKKTHIWKTHAANLDHQLGVTAQASGQMRLVETHTYERARLQQEFSANYQSKPGAKKSGEIFSTAAILFQPNAPHTEHPPLKLQKLSDGFFALSLNGWQVTVNLTDLTVSANAFGHKQQLAPLAATVQNLRSK